MIIGVPTEIKTREYRVGCIPAVVHTLTGRGHEVFVQKGAGLGSGIRDEDYVTAGAQLLDTADEVWQKADMICKVKEPLPDEYPRMREGQIIYTYLHLAAAPELGLELIKRKVTGVAYETIELDDGRTPLLQPMSAVAGRMSIQVAAAYLEKWRGGKGVLLGGVPGVRRGRVVIIGGGVVGQNAARMAIGLGAEVIVLDINNNTLGYIDDIYEGRINTLHSDPVSIENAVIRADVVVGAVLVPGARAPRLVTNKMVAKMEPGSVIVDVAVDQGGCIESCRPTTHDNPTFLVHDVIHYCVANMPGAVSQTSTFALNNATGNYAVRIADLGIAEAVKRDHVLAKGVNTHNGKVTHPAVATALNVDYTPLAF